MVRLPTLWRPVWGSSTCWFLRWLSRRPSQPVGSIHAVLLMYSATNRLSMRTIGPSLPCMHSACVCMLCWCVLRCRMSCAPVSRLATPTRSEPPPIWALPSNSSLALGNRSYIVRYAGCSANASINSSLDRVSMLSLPRSLYSTSPGTTVSRNRVNRVIPMPIPR